MTSGLKTLLLDFGDGVLLLPSRVEGCVAWLWRNGERFRHVRVPTVTDALEEGLIGFATGARVYMLTPKGIEEREWLVRGRRSRA